MGPYLPVAGFVYYGFVLLILVTEVTEDIERKAVNGE